MKAACIALVAVLCLGAASASAQDAWLAGGVQMNKLAGSGEAGNTFSALTKNFGAIVEFGFKAPNRSLGLAMGADWYRATNLVGSHSTKASFLSPFTMEFRYFLKKKGNTLPWIGTGMTWSRMKFEGTDGADNQVLFLASLGVQFRLSNGKMIVQAALKPYVAGSNSLEQSTGIQACLMLGKAW
jgi:hypothetical protein